MDNTQDYYAGRREKERALAAAARDPSIAKIHHELAEHYEMLVTLSHAPRGAQSGSR